MLPLLLSAALAVEIAVTFDDLPFAGRPPEEGRLAATQRLLSHLATRRVPATAFVNCGPGPSQRIRSTSVLHALSYQPDTSVQETKRGVAPAGAWPALLPSS